MCSYKLTKNILISSENDRSVTRDNLLKKSSNCRLEPQAFLIRETSEINKIISFMIPFTTI